ncbi:hypothetical protein [Nocardiopsis sp. NRRL B-16309]|uniref:hypothetical protein n=1 Tax=Nocardiopsis sp. NRRL B-16309 TaxID=1519494 RepID=UPI0006BF4787|nr:hypothetical protein [Nocardiopsis sp. NRRL B-16309]KOX16104.1 hypothetical protein ADL05_12865 [Nocardiopsis sp. NRRL B-16309]
MHEAPEKGHRVLQGRTPRSDRGREAVISVVPLAAPWEDGEQEAFEASPSGVFMVAPLLRVVGGSGRRRLFVGRVRVAATGEERPRVTLALQAVWSEAGGWHEETEPVSAADDDLIASLAEPAHGFDGDAARVAVTMAKAFAEGSRNQVLRLRGLRYELERAIADQLAGRSDTALRPLLAAAVELATAVGRARDQAVEAARQGLWIWLWHDGVYLAGLPHTKESAPAGDLPEWTVTHRAGVRHCEAMDAELAEEASRLHSLLNSMSTFAIAQGSESQDRFTLVAGVGAALVALPALVLSLYGAAPFLPMDSFDRVWRALLPIGITALTAAMVAVRWMPGRASARHYAVTAAVVAGLLSVLLLAGVLVPG